MDSFYSYNVGPTWCHDSFMGCSEKNKLQNKGVFDYFKYFYILILLPLGFSILIIKQIFLYGWMEHRYLLVGLYILNIGWAFYFVFSPKKTPRVSL
ncbi:MAG: hypothetical protein K1X29_11285 [Bdellovibrionales bacterium]|nr:hypothetical protein [Bdellovibrionales bacterium]